MFEYQLGKKMLVTVFSSPRLGLAEVFNSSKYDLYRPHFYIVDRLAYRRGTRNDECGSTHRTRSAREVRV